MMLIVLMFLSSCSIFPEPPSASEVKEFLMQNREDIDIVANYLKELECEGAFITKNDRTIFYEFSNHEISSKKVSTSLRNLWRAGCLRISKNDRQGENTIYFELWHTTVESSDCGIACTINGRGKPKTEFQVSCEQLEEEWFYCYDNYEEYRTHPSNYGENQPERQGDVPFVSSDVNGDGSR